VIRTRGIVAAAILALAASAWAADVPELTLPMRGPVLRIAVAGDTGDGSEDVSKGIARVHAATPLDAVILTGDNFYPCPPPAVDSERWALMRPLTLLGLPLYPVLGNHDYCGPGPASQLQANGRVAHWHLPGRQYVIRSAVADFVMLDTTPYVYGATGGTEQVVQAAFAKSPKGRRRIVVGHHPILSSGWHGYFPKKDVQQMRRLVPALRASGVALYICGHDHHLELVRGNPQYLVSGAGSDPIPPIKLRLNTVFPPEIRWERIGFAVLEVSATRIRVRFYDGEGKPRSGWL
jgi:3',5'-cyclic AMP phosphodiesterase CpdA